MKTIFFTIVVSLFTVFTVIAQENDTDSKSNGGIKAGYNLAAVTFDDESETGQRHGFHVGVYGESYITKAVAIQLELLYSQQGYEINDDSGTFTQKLNYINLPILLKIYPTDNFFIEAGPQIGFAISHKEEFDSNFSLFDTSSAFNPNSFDYGANFGAGIKTDAGVTIGARYHLGLGDIYDEGSPKNRVLQFSLGFEF